MKQTLLTNEHSRFLTKYNPIRVMATTSNATDSQQSPLFANENSSETK